MRYSILAISMILILCCLASAETYLVRPDGTGDFPTIQAALNYASFAGGDIIELTDGTFTGDGNRDLNYLGKPVTVRSRSGDPESCIIDCEGSEEDNHRGVLFNWNEGPYSVLDGVTITHGYMTTLHSQGAGIMVMPSSTPTIRNVIIADNYALSSAGACVVADEPTAPSATFTNCVFLNNSAPYGAGGGFHAWHSSPILTNCVFRGNGSLQGGGGLASTGSSLTIIGCGFYENYLDHGYGAGADCWYSSNVELINCTFAHNYFVTPEYGACGGGFSAFNSTDVTVRGCTFYANDAEHGGGLLCEWSTSLTVLNTIIAYNTGGGALRCIDNSTATLTCCDVYGNAGGDWVGCLQGQLGENGNIHLDPLFCNAALGDFGIIEESPCAPFSPPNDECDLIGAWPVGCAATTASIQIEVPRELTLGPCIPNPFTSTTQIIYSLPHCESAPLHLSVYDITGRLIRTLAHETSPAGTHRVTWDGADHAGRCMEAGTYFYLLRWNGRSETRRVLLVR